MLEGMTDKGAAGSGGAASTGATTSGNVTSGTASAAMIAAATAASSADSTSAGQADKSASTAGAAGSGATSGATGQPDAAATAAAAAAAAKGPIPFDRHEAAVKNAREAAIQEFAWAKGLDPKDVKTALALLQGVRTDARGFYKELGTRLGTAEEKDQPEAYPEADLQGKDERTGEVLKTYSHESLRKALEIHERNILKRLGVDLQPIFSFVNGEREARTTAERQAQTRQQATQLITHARESYPHFKENETAIKEKLGTEAFVEFRKTYGAVAALNAAYAAILKEKVFPGIETAAEEKVRKGFEKKANAGSGGAHPADQGGDGKKPELNNADQLARHMERLAASASA